MKKLILFCLLISLASCQRACTSFDRDVQFTDRNYNIKTYSGGKLISEYNFKGILNNQKNSDGYYFYKNDTLVEVSGDILVKSW